jgi:tetratricopeptide (TPR) repeat protein
MDKLDTTTRLTSLAVTTALAGVLLSGCATNAAPQANVSAARAQEAMAEGRHDRAVRLAEDAVLAEPHNAAYRAMLGKAYMDAGRFASAQTSFDDAMTLGDLTPRTALSLALSLTAQAKYDEAAALLSDWEGHIATADLGLAFALAGQPDRGIALMSNAIRGGENTVKMRQNLAYAYAVAGQWRQARLMAAQDVPADQLGARMEQWAEMSSPIAYQTRIARLLGTPDGVSDSGQPVHLALNNNPSIDQLAAEATALAAAEPATATVVPAAALTPEQVASNAMTIPAAGGELPAVGRASSPSSFAQAFAPMQPAPAQTAMVLQDAGSFAAQPAVAPAPVAAPRAANPAVTPRVAGQVQAPVASARTPSPAPTVARATARAADGTHLVQLGSFSTEAGARRAWGIYTSRYPELAGHELVITEAVVRGRHYYRVSAGGFDRSNSRNMCNRIDGANGDGCISWAAATPLPGAVDNGVRLARR